MSLEKKSLGGLKVDWYQNDTTVTAGILCRNLNREQTQVQFSDDSVDCKLILEDGTPHNLVLNLFKPIVVSESSWKLTQVKLEMILKKQEASRWTHLESANDPNAVQVKDFKQSSSSLSNNNSSEDVKMEETQSSDNKTEGDVSSSQGPQEKAATNKKGAKNWDKIMKEYEEEEEKSFNQGEGSVDDLFRKIYQSGDEETRKAMNKSFTESGGTVLSTNWNEVSKERVQVKPPDGCEHKQWN